ncbi:hypothetical protein DFH09DRAFT_1358426 [Mycena vulgaris]|nr:hypothetical protein DFH09DRAFT_1358426 [Mycena vulgaris]
MRFLIALYFLKMVAPVIPSLADTFGASLIGSWVAATTYGIATSQVFFYFSEYPKDPLGMKFTVAVLWVLHTLQVVFTCDAVFNFLIVRAFNLDELLQNIWSLNLSLTMHLVIALLVMSFFLKIVFLAAQPKLRWWLATLNVVAILLHAAFGIETIYHLFRAKDLIALHTFQKSSDLPMLGTQVAADILLASSLCFVLHRRRTTIKRTNSMLNVLIIYAITRGVIPATAALVELLVMVAKPNVLWYAGAEFPMAGFYVNALLASVNSRHRIMDEGSRLVSNFGLSNITSNTTTSNPRQFARPVVAIDHDTHTFELKDTRHTTIDV